MFSEENDGRHLADPQTAKATESLRDTSGQRWVCFLKGGCCSKVVPPHEPNAVLQNGLHFNQINVKKTKTKTIKAEKTTLKSFKKLVSIK